MIETLFEALDKNLPVDFFKYSYPRMNGIPPEKSVRFEHIYNKMLDKKADSLRNKNDKKSISELDDYTDSSDEFNLPLWRHKFTHEIPDNTDKIKKLNSFIKNSSLPEDYHVYVGLIAKPHKIFHIPQFLSTSLTPRVAVNFSRNIHNNSKGYDLHIIKLKTPKNTKGVYLHGNLTSYKNEHEVLFPANNVLKLTGNVNQYHYMHSNGMKKYTVHIHDAHIMTPDEIEKHKDHPEVQSYLRMKEVLK